jgi:hypothetical protein
MGGEARHGVPLTPRMIAEAILQPGHPPASVTSSCFLSGSFLLHERVPHPPGSQNVGNPDCSADRGGKELTNLSLIGKPTVIDRP